MDEQKFQDIWKEQCVAARSVRAQHGILSALNYLIGEKLLIYAETAVTRPEFARELPRFIAEVREIFSGEEIGHTTAAVSCQRLQGSSVARPLTRKAAVVADISGWLLMTLS